MDVSDNRERITSHYPCEPVLARGALNNLLRLSSNQSLDVLKYFQQLQRFADLGTRGETVAELSCLLMLDSCYSFDANFSLSAFLDRLLGLKKEEIDLKILSVFNITDIQQVPTLNLCQFQLFEQYPKPEHLEQCYKLGMGIIMKVNAAAIDVVLPLRLHDGRYSAIVIQVKNWAENTGSVGAKKILDALGWVRVFKKMTNKAFGQYRDSAIPSSAAVSAEPTEPTTSNAAKKARTSRGGKDESDPVPSQPKSSKKRAAAAALAEAEPMSDADTDEFEAVFKDIPYCKLLFLMRDDGDNELFVAENELETVLCGVLRGTPRCILRTWVRRSTRRSRGSDGGVEAETVGLTGRCGRAFSHSRAPLRRRGGRRHLRRRGVAATGSLAPVDGAGGAGFGDHHFGKKRQAGLELFPDPDGDHLAGGVGEAGHLVEIPVVELFPERAEGGGEFRVLHQPAELFIALAGDGDLHAKAVAVQPAAFVGLGQARQQVRGLELK